MTLNRERPHIFVLPEDDANRQLANGFLLEVDWSLRGRIQVLPVAGGWNHVLGLFTSVHVPEMQRWPTRFMVLLIDSDRNPRRITQALATVPNYLRDRVFIIGVWSEPEDLKAALREPLERIGAALADDCRNGIPGNWNHHLLQHNNPELQRLNVQIRPLLF